MLIMAQAGQYNFPRCMKHGEPEAAQFACNEFADAAMKVLFLLRGKYMPYYKWSFRALRAFDTERKYSERLSFLLCGAGTAEEKYEVIESISADIISELQTQGLTKANCADLEKHAYSVNDSISDGTVRNMHILTAV